MTIIAILLVIIFNLMVSFGLAAIMYYLAILPLNKELSLYKSRLSTNTNTAKALYNMPPVKFPDILPDLDDLPDEALYGDEPQDYKTRPEDVEMGDSRSYNTYRAPQKSSLLPKALNPDA